MKLLSKNLGLAAFVCVCLAGIGSAQAADPAAAVVGRWNASLTQNGSVIPFRLDISGSGPALKGTLYDGFEPYDGTTSAAFHDGKLVLNIEHYLTTITATVKDGQLVGTVATQSRGAAAVYGFQATRYVAAPPSEPNAPSIAGSWEIPLDTPSSKGEKAFRFIVRQRGADVAASILRVDGDTGAYSGTYSGGRWVLSHFDGSRPGVIVVSPGKDGTLDIVQQPERAESTGRADNAPPPAEKAYANSAVADGRYASKLTAYRSDVARARDSRNRRTTRPTPRCVMRRRSSRSTFRT